MKSLIETIIGETYTIIKTGNRWAKTKEHDSLVLDTQNNVFYWNSKGIYGSPYDWLTKVLGYAHYDALKKLEEYSKYFSSNYHVQNNSGKQIITYPRLVDIFWENGKKFRQYWYKRMLTDDTIDKFKLGYFNGWFMIPIFEDYTLKNFQMRRDEPEKRITKWYRGTGVSLWGDDILSTEKEIVFTEGLVDAILLRQYNIPSITTDAGSGGWRDDFLNKFVNQEVIYIVFDNDKAGVKGARRLARKLGTSRCRIYTFEGYREKYDIVDFFRDEGTADEFLEKIKRNYYMVG